MGKWFNVTLQVLTSNVSDTCVLIGRTNTFSSFLNSFFVTYVICIQLAFKALQSFAYNNIGDTFLMIISHKIKTLDSRIKLFSLLYLTKFNTDKYYKKYCGYFNYVHCSSITYQLDDKYVHIILWFIYLWRSEIDVTSFFVS